jgi:hypothetical protein
VRIMAVMLVAALVMVLGSFQGSVWAYPRGDKADPNEGEPNTR